MFITKFNFFKRQRQKYINLPIYNKLVIIFGCLALSLLIVALIAIEITFQSNQKLLYSALSSLMENSAFQISAQITSSVDLTQSMLANEDLQHNLSELKDVDLTEQATPSFENIYPDISKIIYEYFYSFPSKNISYIAVTNGTTTLSTYNKVNRLTDDMLQEITRRAEAAKGNPVLITDYTENYGIFLVRTVRRIDSLRLDALGTIIVNIDIHSLIKEATKTITLSEDVSYILTDPKSKQPFYMSDKINKKNLNTTLIKNNDICVVENNRYFTVKGYIPKYNWEYLCFVEYNSILASRSNTKIMCLLLVLLSAFVMLLISRKLIESLTIHFHYLIRKMIAFGKDDSVLPQIGYDYSQRKDEIGTLQNQFDIMARKIQTLINENYKNELLKKDMQLKNLQNQINPHFLYNTLESINWRAKSCGETEISQMVEALGALLRTSLSPQTAHSTIESELEIVHHYITIQKIRYDTRLMYTEYIAPESIHTSVPLLTIQPLVENSVRYGLETNIDECFIEVSIEIKKDTLSIKILNDGSQFEENMLDKLVNKQIMPHGFGIGILNIHRRIQMIYGNDFGIRLSNPDENHALSEVILPVNIDLEKEYSHD